MSSNPASRRTRRKFLQETSHLTAASVLAGTQLPAVHAAENNTTQLALVGCGGRGTGAAANGLRVPNGPTKLVAMADVFDHRLSRSYGSLKRRYDKQVDVPSDRRFVGFDGYRKALDCLKPGDIAIFTTPPAFRWVHFKYAIEKGLHVFMEKPVTVDGPTTRRMLELARQADEKNLKVGVGLMVRHCRARRELHQRIQEGEIGDLTMLRAYRMSGPSRWAQPRDAQEYPSELMYQIRRFHSFLWASGGIFSDYYIHQVDECCWMKNAWPTQAHALGGRHYRDQAVDQNLDAYAVEYTFEDGTKFFLNGRCMAGCHNEFASYAHGTKGLGIVSTSAHSPGKCRTFSGHRLSRKNMLWAYPQPEKNPYDLEWEDLLDAIKNDRPYNEVPRGATASLVTSMGRMAAHTGQTVSFDDILNCEHEFAPKVDELTFDSPAPLQANSEGRYPVPMPGVNKTQEYDSQFVSQV